MGAKTMKVSIRYFTGTGNSRLLACVCADAFHARGYAFEVADIQRGGAPDLRADAVCFSFPVYALDLPRGVQSYLRNLPRLPQPMPVLLIVSGGDPDNCGWAISNGADILADRGYPVRIGDLIQMPNNWTPFHSAPAADESARMVLDGKGKAEQLVARFLQGESYAKPIALRKFGALGSVLMRTLFHKRGVGKMWSLFRTNAQCNACGLCARICPTGSITMAEGRPVWSETCEQCMRCFNYCPKHAILQLEGLLHGSRHRVYRLPGFDPLIENRKPRGEPR
jgi:ferredoxin